MFFSSSSAAGDVKREIVKLGLKCVSSTSGENCQIYRLENVCANRAETTELYNKITNSLGHIPVWREQLIRDVNNPENDATKHYLGVIKDLTSLLHVLITTHAIPAIHVAGNATTIIMGNGNTVHITPSKKAFPKAAKMTEWVIENPPQNGELKEDYKKRVESVFKIVDNIAFGYALKQAGFVRYKKPYINGTQKRQFVVSSD